MMHTINQLQFTDFDSLYKHYYKRAFLYVKSYVHDELVAEDIAFESLVKLWGQLRTEEIKMPDAFLLTMLKHRALDYLKHVEIKENAFHEMKNIYQEELDLRISMLEACDPEDIFTAEIHQIIQRTLKQFSEQTRRIFEMSRFGNKSNKEIAHALGLTAKSIEYHITKVLKVLRANLRDYLPLCCFFFFCK